jgi:uncharacterized protein (TIGR02302 family)
MRSVLRRLRALIASGSHGDAAGPPPGTVSGIPATDTAPAGMQQSRAALDMLVRRARLTLMLERLWPGLWPPIGVAAAFLVSAWLGLFGLIGPGARQMLVILFGLAFVAALAPLALALFRRPSRREALVRLEADSELGHAPARTLDDALALGGRDPASLALWEIHRRRAAKALAAMRLRGPDPQMARRDRYALRAVAILSVAGSAFIAGPELGSRLGAAFDWRSPPPPGTAMRIDGWIDPPVYTRMPPLMLDFARSDQHLRVPVDSTLVVRIAGAADASLDPVSGLDPVGGDALRVRRGPQGARDGSFERQRVGQGEGLEEQRFRVRDDARLELETGTGERHALSITIIPDAPPEIAFTAPPEVQARGAFNLNYEAYDDYGLAEARALVMRPPGMQERRTLVPAPDLPLALPRSSESGEITTNFDRTEHPWAGARVQLQLEARDDAGQAGYSGIIDFTLPQRPFNDPLARALIEQRRNLVLDPDHPQRVSAALDALMIAPERFEVPWGVWLGLGSARSRLAGARGDEDLLAVADWLWVMALDIEDGGLSDAEEALRAAQERLQQAMDEGASDEELAQLMQELREAMDAYMRELAQRMMRDQQADDAAPMPLDGQRTITQQDLQDMMDAMQEAMRNGDMAEAQRLMDELRNIMQNLQTAQRNEMFSDPHTRELNRQFDELDALTREQEQLRDDTFGDAQDRRMERDRGQDEGSDGAETGEEGLADRQQALRDRLQELQERMRELGMQGEQGLEDAEGAMGDAEQALGEGRSDDAVDSQGRALEGLQQGLQGMADQMQRMFGEGEGEGGGQPGEMRGEGGEGRMGRAEGRDTDPLGRPTRNRGQFESDVRVPGADESPARRARRIIEELRGRLSDPDLGADERDYFERLLR